MNRIIALLAATAATLVMAHGQTNQSFTNTTTTTTTTYNTTSAVNNGHSGSLIKHLDLGISLGTTGIGVDASATLSDVVKLRAGISYTPPVHVPLHFGLTTYDAGAVNSGNFHKAQQLMNQLSGFEIDDVVDITGKPTMFNFKVLADIYPLRNKHWHFTAGFFIGPRKVGTACNTMAEMPSLLAVGIYNKFYDYLVNEEYLDKPIYGDIYIDPDMGDQLREKIMNAGRVGIHIGEYSHDITGPDGKVIHAAGSPYMVEPDKDGMVKAKALVNMFRPYVGFGYETSLSKDRRWNMKVDCGAMMWGGAPKIIAHDGTNLTDDITNIRGKVGDYMDVVTALKVYPTVSIRFSYALF